MRHMRVGFCGAALLPLVLAMCSATGFAAQAVPGAALKRQVSLNIQVRNFSTGMLPVAGISVYGPAKKTPVQNCVSLTANYPYMAETDAEGNQLLRFDFKDFPAFDNRIITVQADLALRETPDKTPEKDMARYLRPQANIESQDPEIKALAKRLQKKDAAATARAIYVWVAENITYAGYNKQPRGARWTLRNRRGDCTEYMQLFIALCRAAGIPARGVSGFVTESNGPLRPESFHDWAEFYSGGAWRLADPQMKNFMQHQTKYLAFKILPESDNKASRTFNLFKADGEGLKAVMMK
jgi:hypothetical protein